jgi:micrococcal nuclease
MPRKTSKQNYSSMNQLVTGLILIAIFLGALLIFSNPSVQDFLVKGFSLENDFKSLLETNSNSEIETAKVVRVVDGDTIELENGDKVRYLNIDTPESKKPGTPLQCYAKEAADYNQDLVLNKTVYLTTDIDPSDRYDRLLRFVFLSREDTDNVENSVNAKLIQNGFARSSIYKPNDTYELEFEEYELIAKNNNIGIWRDCQDPFNS